MNSSGSRKTGEDLMGETGSSSQNRGKREMLLGEYVKQTKGMMPEALLMTYRNKARTLLNKDTRSKEEQEFLEDFVAHVVDVKLLEHERDVKMYLKKDTVQTAARSGQEQVQGSQVQGQEVAIPTELGLDPKPEGTAATVKLHELVATPVKFDGQRRNARRWLDDFERAACSNSWNPATRAKYFQSFLSGAATDWYAIAVQASPETVPSWMETRQAFCSYFIGEEDDLALERQLKDEVQGDRESSGAFIARYARLMILADPGVSQSKMVSAIRIRLKPEVVEKLSGHPLNDLMQLNAACANVEDALQSSLAALKLRAARTNAKGPRGLVKADTVGDKPTETRTCRRCDRAGHLKADCFASKKKDGTALMDKAPKAVPPRKQVVNAIEEEIKPTIESPEDGPEVIVTKQRKTCLMVVCSSSSRKQTLLTHQVELNGISINALIDTGSENSIISSELASIQGWVPKGPAPELAAADSSPIKCFGSVTVDLVCSIGDTTKRIREAKFIVAENLCKSVIIGLEILRWFKIVIDPEFMCLRFKKAPKEKRSLVVAEESIIPARSQMVIEAKAPNNVLGVVRTVPFGGGVDVLVANTVDEVIERKLKVLCSNIDVKPKKLGVGQVLCGYELLPGKPTETVAATMQVSDSDAYVTVGDDLTSQQVEELSKLIKEYSEAFSINGQLGCTNLLSHDIELEDGAVPWAEPLRRRPRLHIEETRRQVDEMMKKGIVEESSSPWASAYVLAKKKTGELRLCVDFRRLNNVTKKCAYPLPNIDSCVDTLAGKKFFSQLDMASGFWQVPLSENAKALTSFRTENGQYQFTRMPFGLTNAPASFQRLVNILFAGVTGLDLQVFIDDLCIATSTWEEHLVMLGKVFALMVKANLRLKASKCVFGVRRVIFLGHELSEDGIRQDPEKLSALSRLPRPKTVKELRATLGMLNYYRKFVPRYAALAEPMTALLKKGAEFRWEAPQEESLATVIGELMKNGVLKHFDHSAPTALKTDACKIGIAAILLQQDQGEWRIVCCCSRSTSQCERNYAITELEALALVYAVTKLRHYLLGKRFKIITDHCALCACFKQASSNARLNRWRLALQEYEFDVVYTKGSMHTDVDCLSRQPIGHEVDEFLEDKLLAAMWQRPKTLATLVVPLKRQEWAAETSSDPEAPAFFMKAKHRRDGFKLVDGLLYFRNRLFVPEGKRAEIVRAAHAGNLACHGGVKATLHRLEAFWWPSLSKDTARAVESCRECQMRKIPRVRAAGEMHSFDASTPMQLVAVDCLGPLTESLGRKKHVMVAIDVFTRFAMAKAVKDVRASTFIKFISELMSRFGVPQTILTDNAPTFANDQVRQLEEAFGWRHVFSTPHHHQGNGSVERLIQTLQTKLSLLAKDERRSDWEEALPRAVLSINTSVCSSTGFAPFELMFGRKHPFVIEHFALSDPTASAHRQKLVESNSRNWAAAGAKQDEMRLAAKQRYDRMHDQIAFEIGDLVLAKKSGRLNKLSNRYDGPFKVIAKEKDIYTLQSEETQKHIQRHVQDMKRFHVLLHVLLITSAAKPSQELVFNRAAPVLWTESDQYVSPGYSHLQLHILFASPCRQLLSQLAPMGDPAATEAAINRCETLFHEHVTSRVMAFNKETKNGSSSTQKSMQRPSANEVQPSFPTALNGQPGTSYVRLPKQPAARLQKRGTFSKFFGQAASMGESFVAYAAVSTIVETIVSRWWQGSASQDLQAKQSELQKAVRELVTSMNATQLSLVATNEVLVNQATLLNHAVHDIHSIAFTHPQLMIMLAHITARIVQTGAELDRLRVAMRSRKPDLQSLALLFNTAEMDELDADSIPKGSVQATSPEVNSLYIEFAARKPDASTKIFGVDAFRFWTNLTETPVQMEYVGPEFLVFNASNHCVRGIAEPKNKYVNVRCLEEDFEDPSLAQWNPVTTSSDPWGQPARSVVKEGWPYVYVYCFPLNVTLQGGTVACPPFVFRLNATTPFSTSDHYIYNPSSFEMVARAEMVVKDVDSIHFANASMALDDNAAIRKIVALRQELKQTNERLYAISFSGGGGVSYTWVTNILLGVYGASITVWIAWLVRSEGRNKRRHKEVIASVVDRTYGSRVYETLDRKRSDRKVVVNVNATGIPLVDKLPGAGSGGLGGGDVV